MERHELSELHYITPIDNISSIQRWGILSHRRAQQIDHKSVAQPEIQERRAKVVVPVGRKLHEYANLYICARNPMMYKRKSQHADLCVLRVSPNVLDLEGVVITDGNASSDYARFAPAPSGLVIVDRALTFTDNWTHHDPIEYYRRKFAKCAEVLVRDHVPTDFIIGTYVSCQMSLDRVSGLKLGIHATINSHMFFR